MAGGGATKLASTQELGMSGKLLLELILELIGRSSELGQFAAPEEKYNVLGVVHVKKSKSWRRCERGTDP
jgi:hypothetical protein